MRKTAARTIKKSFIIFDVFVNGFELASRETLLRTTKKFLYN